MAQMHIIALLVAIALYSIVNSTIIMSFFARYKSNKLYVVLLCDLLSKTIISIVIAFLFFIFMARAFCWTAWLAKCAECICLPLSLEEFALQNSIPSNILFFASVTAVQLALIRIPQLLSKMKFVTIVLVSNLMATIVKMVIISVWGI